MSPSISSSATKKQKRLTIFFDATSANKRSRKETPPNSRFGTCPICSVSFPRHTLESHAASCNGVVEKDPLHKDKRAEGPSLSSQKDPPHKDKGAEMHSLSSQASIPGLFLYENFITEEDESKILRYLDAEAMPWKPAQFNGKNMGKRWGVHCNLRDKRVDASDRPLPDFIQNLLLPKLKLLAPMMGCVPNEANAIDYRRKQGHWLKSHVDDRKLSKEPIVNLSLAGDCYMTFRNQATHRNLAVTEQKVLLKRRCIQILTGNVRYDFSHGIANHDLHSDRRVSVTMRQSPLTSLEPPKLKLSMNADPKKRLFSGDGYREV
jgi:alkylated DNA repair dioxygenase AlkB